MIQSTSDPLICPHCHKLQHEPVEDFVLHTLTGKECWNSEPCLYCDRWIKITPLGNGKYEVEKEPE